MFFITGINVIVIQEPQQLIAQPSFVQLQVTSGSSVPTVELQLGDGRRLLFHQPVSSDYLKSLIS
jgi:hypothetical protein